MHFPPFWARAEQANVVSWDWSDVSLQDAEARARRRATEIADRLASRPPGDAGPHPAAYGYGDRPLREQVLERVDGPDNQTVALVTRNKYGCLILNTHVALFIDIDIPGAAEANTESPRTGRSIVTGPPGPYAHEGGPLRRIEAWSDEHPGWGWRVYRTRAGMRLLATHQPFTPEDPVIPLVFKAVDADPLYERLCHVQKSFRARLTPKPWRCGLQAPPDRWPFSTADGHARFVRWEKAYRTACSRWATCRWIARFGSDVIHPAVQPVLTLHDNIAFSPPGGPLA